MIIPSIDLMGGKAVQLRQGKDKVLERDNVLELAAEFSKYGEIAVIDLDAALGSGNNLELIKKICKIADCRVGGGIRTIEKANEMLQAGAKKVIIGTKATPKFLAQLPKDRVIAAIDAKEGVVVNKGWTAKTSRTPKDLIKELEPYCCEFLFTDVDREGLMKGIDFGKIKLDEAFVSLLDFSKNNGLIPTIVQDEQNQALMLAFSNEESLVKTLREGKATYYSRSRKRLWTKGETSGNCQEIFRVRYDCDRDTLLFTVNQKNIACHYGQYSCFGEKKFSFQELYDAVADRINKPRDKSYTSKIAAS